MNIFDIIGPIMVGPSSSHTAGVVRIGNVVQKILGGTPQSVQIRFHGSFAKTYVGHGSDKAVIAGLMGFQPDDERIRDSLGLAEEMGLVFGFEPIELPSAHPNTVVIDAFAEGYGNIHVVGESVGGGNILIRYLDDIEVEFDGQYDTVIIHHEDMPGAIALVTNLLSVERINIAKMKVYRSRKGGNAIMIIETDAKLDKGLIRILEVLPHINRATVISGL